jgi:hypothetical protein
MAVGSGSEIGYIGSGIEAVRWGSIDGEDWLESVGESDRPTYLYIWIFVLPSWVGYRLSLWGFFKSSPTPDVIFSASWLRLRLPSIVFFFFLKKKKKGQLLELI